LRFAIYAQNLLACGVRPAGEVARFHRSRPAFCADEATNVHIFLPEIVQKCAACVIFSDCGDRENAGAEIDQIVGGVGAASREQFGFAMTQN
jgi:hypothetical protein